jgi:hypothetical protein
LKQLYALGWPPSQQNFNVGDWREYSCQQRGGKSEWDRTPEIWDE